MRPTDPGDDPGCGWMLRFQGGDDDAFRQLVAHYGERVVHFFCRRGADRSSAEDLAQEAFLRVARAKERYEATAKFTTWLHQIMVRIAINDAGRNRWRRAIGFKDARDDEGAVATRGLPELRETPENDPARVVSLAELKERVRAAVATLPEPQRTALLLSRFEGCSYEEICAVLELSLPAVKSLLFRARESLKQRLLPLLGEEVSDGE